MAAPCDALGLQSLLVTLLDLGRTIANDRDDPMSAVLAAAAQIDSVAPSDDSEVLITTTDRRRIRITISADA